MRIKKLIECSFRTGKRISNTVMVSRPGQMVLSMKANTSRAKKMEMVDLHGLTDQPTTVFSTRITSKVPVNIIGPMVENITVYG